MNATHETFTLERDFTVPPERVFRAFAEPAARRRWFAPGTDHTQDFTVGGIERVAARVDSGAMLVVVSRYHQISPERIAYTSTLSSDGELSTVSLTTVEFAATTDGTRLTLTEHGAYLPGYEQPAWRRQGTSDQLDALAKEFEGDE